MWAMVEGTAGQKDIVGMGNREWKRHIQRVLDTF